jgi:haloacetate dehalogenase
VRIQSPTSVLQQGWGAVLGYDDAAVWRAWAPDLEHATTTSGHFMAEEDPSNVVATLRALPRR